LKTFTLHEVITRLDEREWLDVPRWLYRNNPTWVSPLDVELRNTFKPAKNKLLQEGSTATRWFIRNADGRAVGRIAAFVHHKKAYQYDQPTGGIGFFECVNDQAAANTLFDAGQTWLQARDMQAMDGPVNLGENDKFTGTLVQGFTQPGYGMFYNPPYYADLFKNYGWQVYFEQTTRHLDITRPMPARFSKVYEWVKSRPGIRFEMIDPDNLVKYALDFRTIYNDAWQHHVHFTPITEAQAHALAEELKGIVLPYFSCFAYVDNEPAAMVFCMPDLNQIFKPLRGKLGIWDALLFLWRKRNQFAWYRKRGILTRGRVTIVGTRPKFQRYGLEVGVTMYPMQAARDAGFSEIELGWVGDFNPVSRSMQAATAAELGKVHEVYRYMFDRSKPVQRMESLLEARQRELEAK